jgi:hypothetical protein
MWPSLPLLLAAPEPAGTRAQKGAGSAAAAAAALGGVSASGGAARLPLLLASLLVGYPPLGTLQCVQLLPRVAASL